MGGIGIFEPVQRIEMIDVGMEPGDNWPDTP
jgi:hypothetical protein